MDMRSWLCLSCKQRVQDFDLIWCCLCFNKPAELSGMWRLFFLYIYIYISKVTVCVSVRLSKQCHSSAHFCFMNYFCSSHTQLHFPCYRFCLRAVTGGVLWLGIIWWVVGNIRREKRLQGVCVLGLTVKQNVWWGQLTSSISSRSLTFCLSLFPNYLTNDLMFLTDIWWH